MDITEAHSYYSRNFNILCEYVGYDVTIGAHTYLLRVVAKGKEVDLIENIKVGDLDTHYENLKFKHNGINY